MIRPWSPQATPVGQMLLLCLENPVYITFIDIFGCS